MPKDKDSKERKRMVVEEVSETESQVESPKEETPVSVESAPAGEIKEKVEELKDINQEISESVEKSEEVQEEIVEAAEKVEPVAPQPIPVSEDQPVSRRPGGPSPLAILIPGVLLLGALLGGIAFYQKSLTQNATETPVPTNFPDVTETPSPAPSSEVDKEKYTIKVLNGSGTKGEAGVVKTLLEKAGFKVGTTGNAATYDYKKTVIQAKSSVEESFTKALSDALSEEYEVETEIETLPSTSTDTVVVIVGSTKAK